MIKPKRNYIIFFVCIFLGITLAIQFNTVNKVVGKEGNISEESKKLSDELAKLNQEKERLSAELMNIENQIRAYESEATQKDNYEEEVTSNLFKYRTFGGAHDVQGPGIIMTIDNMPLDAIYGDDIDFIVENYDYILTFISILNANSAEFISINDIRYTSYTTLRKVDNSLEIDGLLVNSPIVIKAIGDANEMESKLTMRGGMVEHLLYNGYKVNIKKSDNVVIPKTTRLQKFKFAKPVNEIN